MSVYCAHLAVHKHPNKHAILIPGKLEKSAFQARSIFSNPHATRANRAKVSWHLGKSCKKWKQENRASINKNPGNSQTSPSLNYKAMRTPASMGSLFSLIKVTGISICCASRSALLYHHQDLAFAYMTLWYQEAQQKPDLTASWTSGIWGKDVNLSNFWKIRKKDWVGNWLRAGWWDIIQHIKRK